MEEKEARKMVEELERQIEFLEVAINRAWTRKILTFVPVFGGAIAIFYLYFLSAIHDEAYLVVLLFVAIGATFFAAWGRKYRQVKSEHLKQFWADKEKYEKLVQGVWDRLDDFDPTDDDL